MMSRQPLKPISLNVKRLKVTTSASKTRPSMSQNMEMAANSVGPSPCGLNSPMTNLAMNLSELSTGRGTPKRRLSLSSIDTPPTDDVRPPSEKSSSVESGVFVDSPTLLDSPTLEGKKTIAFRRINSLPPPSMRLDCDSPTEFMDTAASDNSNSSSSEACKAVFFMDDGSSQDSGISCGLDKDPDFKFAAPVGIPRRKSIKLNEISEETCSPHKYSPVKSPQKRSLSFSINSFGSVSSDGDSPVRLKRSSLTCVEGDFDDDGFLDLVDQEVSEINDQVPESFSSLFNEPVINRPRKSKDDTTPVSRRILPAKRFLHRSQSVDNQTRQFKRTERPRDETFLVQNKRWKSEQSHDDSSTSLALNRAPVRRLHRCHSETEAMIKSAVSRMSEEPDLIGDSSKACILPTMRGKHQDLKTISPETVARLISQEFSDHVEEFHIIDCRYPYEFEGGHIQDARNIYNHEVLVEEYLKNPRKPEDPNKRFLLIFHCEFSSERGPRLFRHLRSKDRESNKECYPFLHYPEMYLLEGGYKAFFEQFKELCAPQTYKQMLHKDHAEDLRKFRAKSKSWAGEKNNSRTGLRTLKF